jgi:seryl-tRNA synthetase
MLMGQAKKDPSKQAEAEAVKAQVKKNAERLAELESRRSELGEKITTIMMTISPRSSTPACPSARTTPTTWRCSASASPRCPILRSPTTPRSWRASDGIDMDAAGRVAGNGFYYLLGDIARLHEAVLAYARDFMIGKGFTYCIPPFMITATWWTGVMSFPEMDAMMYKIEGEDLYLIGTSEHSMIGRFIDQILPEERAAQDPDQLFPLLPQGEGRPRHRGARRLPHPPV